VAAVSRETLVAVGTPVPLLDGLIWRTPSRDVALACLRGALSWHVLDAKKRWMEGRKGLEVLVFGVVLGCLDRYGQAWTGPPRGTMGPRVGPAGVSLRDSLIARLVLQTWEISAPKLLGKMATERELSRAQSYRNQP